MAAFIRHEMKITNQCGCVSYLVQMNVFFFFGGKMNVFLVNWQEYLLILIPKNKNWLSRIH